MTSVAYSQAFPYLDLGAGASPAIQVVVGPLDGRDGIEVDAYLDSGASDSLFNGELLQGLGMDLFDGRERGYQGTNRTVVKARLHRVQLSHDRLGSFELEVGFSIEPISRNLLGRDFFNLIQLGFREHQRRFFVEPSP